MFCSKCGTKALDSADFCQNCGAKLIKNEVKNSPTEDIQPNAIQNQGAVPVAAVPASGNSTYSHAKNEKPAKKKSKKRFFMI